MTSPTPLSYSLGASQAGAFIVSPRDSASGLPTGKSSGIIAVLIG
jgi:hypothetical protein